MTDNVTSCEAPLFRISDTSVKRILHHIDRLMTFHTVEWFLQERNKEAVLKMNFTQDRNYTGMFQPDTMDSLPRVRDHIERLSKSHRLREWDLRETDGHATIVVAFQFMDFKSREDLFFMTSSHLKFVEDSRGKTDLKPKSVNGGNPDTSKGTDESEVPVFEHRNDGCQTTTGVESSGEVSLPYLTPIKVTQLPPRRTNLKRDKEDLPKPDTDHRSSGKLLIKADATTPRTSENPAQNQNSSAVSTRSNKGDMSSKSLSLKTPLKSKCAVSSSGKGSAIGKGQAVTQNPFSVNGVTTGAKNNTGSKLRARSNKQPLNGKVATLQRSKSTSSIKLSTDIKAHQSGQSSSRNAPKTGFSSSRFTFRKSYSKSKLEQNDKSVQSNIPIKRKTDYLDDTDTDEVQQGTRSGQPPSVCRVKSTQTAQVESHKSGSESTGSLVSSESTKEEKSESVTDVNTPARDKSGDAFSDLYRLYFSDNADISMCNSDASFIRQFSSQRSSNTSANNNPHRQYSSTPANKSDTTDMALSTFGDLFRQYFPDNENTKCSLTEIAKSKSASKEAVAPGTSNERKDILPYSRPSSSTSGLGESRSSDTESSVEDNPQETTLTEASRTSESSEAFSCCTEPCLEEEAKVEIQDYYLKIYNQIHRDIRVDTDQLVWCIDDSGRICLYHKNLKQTKIHNVLSPEELLEVDQDGSSRLIPGAIKEQYVFRRLLEELDQVTFDNRALSSTEKKRLDRLLHKMTENI